jgi:hypothetical protein
MKILSDDELIAIGLQIQEARSKGGQTILKTYGTSHFSKLGKISAEKRKQLKNKAKLVY